MPGGANLLAERCLACVGAGLDVRDERREVGGDNENVEDRGGGSPFCIRLLVSDVAGPSVMYGTALGRVPDSRRALPMSFVETARCRLPVFCWISMPGLTTWGEASEPMDAMSNGGRPAGSDMVEMYLCCCAVV